MEPAVLSVVEPTCCEQGLRNSPTNFAKTTDCDDGFLSRFDFIRFVTTIPREDRSVNEVVFGLVHFRHRHLPLRQSLLRRSNCRVVKSQMNEINGEKRDVLQRYADRRPEVQGSY